MTARRNGAAPTAALGREAQVGGQPAAAPDERIRVIVERFAQRLEGYGALLQQEIETMRSGDAAERKAAMERLQFVSHQLAGSAATFGFAAIGAVAADVEECVIKAVADDASALEAIVSAAARLLATINDHSSRPGA